MEQLPEHNTDHSPASTPTRGILAKMALAGVAAAAVGAIGIASVASASSDKSVEPIQPLPMDIPMEQGASLTLEDLTNDVKELVGLGEHGDMENWETENWDDCPACGMG